MTESASAHDGVQDREPERIRFHGTSSFSRQVFNSVRRERRGPSSAPSDQEAGNGARAERPKTPRFHLRMPMLPSTRLQLPHLTLPGTGSRPPTVSAEQSRSSPEPPPSGLSAHPSQGPSVVPEPPRVVVAPGPEEAGSRSSSSSGDTLTNEPRELGSLAQARGAVVGDVDGTASTEGERPKRLMGCFPRIRSKRLRSQVIRCFISGLFLIFLLGICECSVRRRFLAGRSRAN